MQTREILRQGQFIVIEVAPGENWPFIISSVSSDYKVLTCELIVEQRHPIDMSEDKEFLVTCITEGGVYKFPTRITEVKQDPAIFTLSLLEGMIHVQRRKFFRLSRPCISVKYRPVSGPEDIFSGELIEAPVKDLSGNGIAIIAPLEAGLAVGTPIRIELELTGDHNVSLIGQITRYVPNEPISGKSLLCAHFELINEWDRDHIISDLLKEQVTRVWKRHRLSRGL
ncbi:MAG TPA: PilZ domain-containing protein [Anaerolineae bacterium]|jgi:c-di-GMP-binding flagellar brake protein YcgR|nr:PilZ domain-containing protein [Anaerolineae bacterium]